MISLLLMGAFLSCGDLRFGLPIKTYDSLPISSFSVLDGNGNKVSDKNNIPLDALFFLEFSQSLGDDYGDILTNQIELTDENDNLISLDFQTTQTNIKISPTINLSYSTTYWILIKKGLTIGDYRVKEDIVYKFITEMNPNSDSSLTVIYSNAGVFQTIYPDEQNNVAIPLPATSDEGDVKFTLEVKEGATIFHGSQNLPLNSKHQYLVNVSFVGGTTHDFTVISQNKSTTNTYTIGLSRRLDSGKEITSFIFQRSHNSFLSEDIVMNIDGQNVTKTTTNVEGVNNNLTPTIAHNGLSIFPASGVSQDFSTNNTYTVTAENTTTSDYIVSLTNYFEVNFDTNGGNINGAPTTTQYVISGNKVPSLPSDPSQEHYGFKGWYDAPSGGNIFDFNASITTQTTVYAQWTNKQYRVRFYQGLTLLDTIPVTSLTVISTSDYPDNSTPKQWYRWYSDNGLTQAFNTNAQVTGNLDLYAKIISGFQKIMNSQVIPTAVDLADYGNMGESVFSRYTPGAALEIRYVAQVVSGTGDGSSWANASGDIQAMIDGINDASKDKIYMIMIESGTYTPIDTYVMKNHVALIGGFIAGSDDRMGKTHLDGNNNKRVFSNNNNGLDQTALLYGVTVANGRAGWGGGMYNFNSSPTLINVTFSDNEADTDGGAMYNSGVQFDDSQSSSPILINVTFLNNTANRGGAMYNISSSPILNNVTFSGNTASTGSGGGIYNRGSSSTLINTTFFDNTATTGCGAGIYHDGNGEPLTLINTILWGNNNGNICVQNDGIPSDTEILHIYHSLIEGGSIPSTNASGIRLGNIFVQDRYDVSTEGVIASDPNLGTLANHGGEVNTILINNGSPAQNMGVYVKGVRNLIGNPYTEDNLFYSPDNINWYTDPSLMTPGNPPNNANDFTTTDAREYGRVDRPDMGAYEIGGSSP